MSNLNIFYGLFSMDYPHKMVLKHQLDPVNFPVGKMLERFSTEFFAYNAHLSGKSLGRKPLVSFSLWCFEAVVCKSREVSGLGSGHCVGRPISCSVLLYPVRTLDVYFHTVSLWCKTLDILHLWLSELIQQGIWGFKSNIVRSLPEIYV